MKSKSLFIFINILCCSLLISAPLQNVPIKLTQPDGREILCYASGDEFYNWVHDSLGNIIVKDSISKYYCYMLKNSDSLVIIGEKTDVQSQFEKNPKDYQNERNKNIQLYNQIEKKPYIFRPSTNRNSCTINNLVIYITFYDQTDFTSTERQSIGSKFIDSTTNANSMKQYFWESSYHQLKVNSTFYPNITNVYSYHDIFPRDFYCPYSQDNPIGYDTASATQRRQREESLIIRAISYVENQIPSTLNLDSDNDGNVDNICFVIKGETTEWNELLWPHKSSLSQDVSIHQKNVYNYIFLLSDYLIVRVICHEFGHTLGLPDLYHYSKDVLGHEWKPVGTWDLMSTTSNSLVQTSGYMKNEYLHWINNIPEISQSGRYTLSPMITSQQGYKIHMAGSSEYLYLENRNKSLPYDTSLPNSGLLIYRINPEKPGNCDAVECGGLNDRIYLYRPGGNFLSDGNLSLAPFCEELNAITFNQFTNPSEFLSNGNFGNIFISNVSACDSIVSFDVKICSSEDVIYNQNSNIPSYTTAKTITTTGNININDNTIFEASESIILKDGFKVTNGNSFKACVKACE